MSDKDKEIFKLARKPKSIKKRRLFLDYCTKFINLGVENKGNGKKARRELEAIAARGARMVIRSQLKDSNIPKNMDGQPFITIVIYAGTWKKVSGKEEFTYPDPLDRRIEEI